MFQRLVAVAVLTTGPLAAADRPNVLIVLTDDQGYGDLGYHGNPILMTPNIDAFAKRGVQLTHFYVSPVCAPTRSSLMTGRYNYRTGVVDTFLGRAMMRAEEVTLAEMLRDAGYRTGLFGKWHLGDNYPMRPQDQGFEEVLMHRGGGIAQPSDPPGGSSYTDPILFHNGQAKPLKGYVSNVLTDAAIDFVAKPSDKPFFAYVAYNCPHAPYQVREEDWKPYRGIDLGPDSFSRVGSPWAGKKLNQDEIGRAYGMIANLDANFGRLLAKVPDNTLVIFLTDNGPGGVRWNAGLRNRKGAVYEGGIRVPFFAAWKGHLPAGRTLDTAAAHIDITPTVLEACGVPAPKGVVMDGRSVLPLLKAEKVDWPHRHLFFQWHRGDVPEPGRAFAVRGPRYKLVQAAGVQSGKYEPKYELFDIPNDPFEQNDVAAKQPEVVRDLKARYDAWFKDVTATLKANRPRIHVGSEHENPTVLTRQDWRGPAAGWGPNDVGHWDVFIERTGKYKVTVTFDPAKAERKVLLRVGGTEPTATLAAGKSAAAFENLAIGKGDAQVEAWADGGKKSGAKYVEIERVGD
jgi:arylsulfatase A-like enzyme